MDQRPIRRIRPDPAAPPSAEQRACWPLTVPAVAQLVDEGLELPAGALVLVGENGSGKSTVMELLAVTLGLNPEGGSVNARHRTRASEPESLGLVVERSPGASRWGYFLRDETLHGLYSYLEANPSDRPEPLFHELSHGEAFLEVLTSRAAGRGVYLLDEPDAALSFGGSLALVSHLLALLDRGAQVVVATHSPVVAALPGATLLEVGGWGMRPAVWSELELTTSWRQFLDSPEAFLRHLR
ncbi:AAA family ATPase [uncultured Modestobacter sp.]|uniref:AAA family ATPase n=1 Tax=uncultured Modestobacter sp. TaxID=380048 RepID=UPI002630D083|nr:AAA family ATPase [uncultured Modestobacter sp.]